MAVNTILVDGPSYYGMSGGVLELRARYDYFNFNPVVGDKVLVKNTDFWSSYDPSIYGSVTDIYITELGEDTQANEYNAAVHTTIGPQFFNLLASSTGAEFTVTAIAADPDDAGKQLLTLQAPLLDKAVGLDGARFIRDKIKAKQDKLTAGSNISIAADGKTISATDTTYSAMTGATASVAGTSGLVPAPAAGDEDKALKGDGTWGDFSEEFVIMKYGEANAWAKFIDAYSKNKIVYCRASSNANPATGSQTRLAFMAYVSNETNPTNVEFQYVRSVGTKTSSQPVDQVFVYKLESSNGGTWSVQTRDMAPKIAAGTGINVSYSNGTYTISLA